MLTFRANSYLFYIGVTLLMAIKQILAQQTFYYEDENIRFCICIDLNRSGHSNSTEWLYRREPDSRELY